MLKKVWVDPVWSKVIASTIIAIAALSVSYFLDWWPSIAHYSVIGIEFASAASPVSNWIIAIFSLLAVPIVIFFTAIIWQSIFPSKSSAIDWQTYTSDNFFGLCWRWQYYGERISGMNTFCPHCDFQVFSENASSFTAIDRITFHCESCGRSLGTFEEPFSSLKNKACRFAQQKLRQGTWQSKNVV